MFLSNVVANHITLFIFGKKEAIKKYSTNFQY